MSHPGLCNSKMESNWLHADAIQFQYLLPPFAQLGKGSKRPRLTARRNMANIQHTPVLTTATTFRRLAVRSALFSRATWSITLRWGVAIVADKNGGSLGSSDQRVGLVMCVQRRSSRTTRWPVPLAIPLVIRFPLTRDWRRV